MKQDGRFIEVFKEGNGLTSNLKMIFIDKETGVNYLFIQSGYGGGLTPLLDADGHPVVSRL